VGAQDLPTRFLGVVPKSVAWRLMRPFMNRPGVRAVNALRYRLSRLQGRRRFRRSHAAFAFPLDYVPDWKRACGPEGLIQYQSFIPAAHAARVFREQLILAGRAGLLPYIGVLKRHRTDAFLMSHAVDGYSLALDFKLTRRNRAEVWALAARFDRLVLDAGGRFYLAKDLTLDPAGVRASLGDQRVRRFLELKRECDPEERLQTDLYRRLFKG
jgi:decaprenylphospho-beta-D-ribofuranose 2-oxidase